jgi:Fis family transcriptional regulator
MTRAQPLTDDTSTHSDSPLQSGEMDKQFEQGHSLRDAVTVAMQNYLRELDGQLTTDVYPMVLAEIEAPLLTQIMEYTRNNQTKASIMLGLNRGTLRKKLKQYKLIAGDQE